MAELADALRSGRSGQSARESSNLSFGINAVNRLRFFIAKAVSRAAGIILASRYAMQSPWEKLKQFHWNDRRLILVAVIILLVLLMMGFNNRMVRALELEEQAQAMTTRMAELEQTKVYLEAQIAFATSEKAVEQWAREDAKLIKEGDVPIIILPPSKPTPTPTPAPLVQEKPLSNFEIWKALFLGE